MLGFSHQISYKFVTSYMTVQCNVVNDHHLRYSIEKSSGKNASIVGLNSV